MGMKITISSEQDALSKIKELVPHRHKYDGVYYAVENLEKDKCVVLEFDTNNEANNVRSVLSNRRYRGDKTMKNCYITKSGNIVIVGKN